MTDSKVFFNTFTKFISIHSWHHHITDNNVWCITLYQLKRLHSIRSYQHLFKIFTQCLTKKVRQIRIIIHNQNRIRSCIKLLSFTDMFTIIVAHQLIQISFRLTNNLFSILPQRQFEEKCGTCFLIIPGTNGAAMQFNQYFRI